MATSKVGVTEGAGKNIATHSFTGEDSLTKDIQRVELNDSTGAEILGLLTGSPAANTIGARLKDLLTGIILAVGSVVKFDQSTEGTTNRVVAGKTTYIDVTLVVDTAIYAAGDVLVAAAVSPAIMRVADFGGILQSLVVIDEADQGMAMDVYFFSTAVTSLGAANAVPAISDADARSAMGPVPVSSGDFRDLGGVRVATINNIGMVLKPLAGAQTVYIAAVNGTGTPTYATASDLKLRLGMLLD